MNTVGGRCRAGWGASERRREQWNQGPRHGNGRQVAVAAQGDYVFVHGHPAVPALHFASKAPGSDRRCALASPLATPRFAGVESARQHLGCFSRHPLLAGDEGASVAAGMPPLCVNSFISINFYHALPDRDIQM